MVCKVYKPRLGLVIIIIILFIAALSSAQSRLPLSKDKVTEIQSMPNVLWQEAKIEITKGKDPKTLEARLQGKIKAIDGILCFGCVEEVKIAPDLKIPIDPFFINFQLKNSNLQMRQEIDNNAKLSTFIIVPEGLKLGKGNYEGFIVSGPNGATLKKKGKGFLLLSGKADLLH